MSAAITLAGAIAGLVAEKRAVGYKYVSRGAGAGPVRGVLRQRVPRSGDGHASRRWRRGSPRRGGGR